MRCLLIEDDADLAKGVAHWLNRHGCSIDTLAAAEAAEEALRRGAYDLMILDIGLPRMDGFALMDHLRTRGIDLPTIVLTARDAIDDRIRGLNAGADDYLVKPFALSELLARCHAVLRRVQGVARSVIVFDPLQIDLGLHKARLNGDVLDLTAREWEVLRLLMMAAPSVVSRRQIVVSLARHDREITANAVEIYVSRLRGKLVGAEAMIRTVRGMGYRLEHARFQA